MQCDTDCLSSQAHRRCTSPSYRVHGSRPFLPRYLGHRQEVRSTTFHLLQTIYISAENSKGVRNIAHQAHGVFR